MADQTPEGSQRTSESRSRFTSRFNRAFAILAWVLCALAIVAVIFAQNARSLYYLAPIAFVAWAGWAAYWQPTVVFDDS
jgi:amino acid permease